MRCQAMPGGAGEGVEERRRERGGGIIGGIHGFRYERKRGERGGSAG